jgi:choline transport protein
MLYTVLANSVTAFGFTICLLYCLGDYNAALETPTGLPIIQVFYGATKSVPATNTLMSFILIVTAVGNFSNVASVSRLAWAFARDGGLPFSSFFSHVSSPTIMVYPKELISPKGSPNAEDPCKRPCFGFHPQLPPSSH